MSKKSNPTMIGAFVVGAILLLVGGVAIFGGSELLAKRTRYLAYFAENTKGLRVGSNVLLNGVRIGYVSEMSLVVDPTSFEGVTEVVLEILPDTFLIAEEGMIIGKGATGEIPHDKLIDEGGLRAELGVESFVTGQLLVTLDFGSTVPAVRRAKDPRYPEVPTTASDIQKLLAGIQSFLAKINESFDPEELGARVSSILKGVDELSNSEDVRQSLAGVNRFVNNDDTQDLSSTLQDTLTDVSGASRDAGQLFRNADAQLTPLLAEFRPVGARLIATLDEATEALAAAKEQLGGETEQIYQLDSTLKEVELASRTLREFLDYLERNPESLLRGKRP